MLNDTCCEVRGYMSKPSDSKIALWVDALQSSLWLKDAISARSCRKSRISIEAVVFDLLYLLLCIFLAVALQILFKSHGNK